MLVKIFISFQRKNFVINIEKISWQLMAAASGKQKLSNKIIINHSWQVYKMIRCEILENIGKKDILSTLKKMNAIEMKWTEN